MIAISKIEMDLNWYDKPKIEAIQDDKYSRNVEISLVTDGTPWPIPTGATAVVNYVKADGTGGEYDTMPNGETAWSVSGNVLTVKLAPQVLTAPGAVHMGVTLILEHKAINTFQIVINVHKNVAVMLTTSENYKHVVGFIPMPDDAAAGQYIVVEEVDAEGKIKKVKTVAGLNSTQNAAQSDWNAAPGENGHVLNRTHYEEGTVDIPFLPEMVVALDEGGLCYHLGALPFAEGKTYLIVLNGDQYVSECRHVLIDEEEEEYGLLIGNPLALELEDDGCPIALASVPGYSVTIIAPVYEDQSVEGYTLAVYERQDVVHKLDNKYVDAAWMAQKTVTQTEILGKTGLVNVVLPKIYEQTRYLDKVRVVYDGVSYECAVSHFDDMDIFGNLNAMTGGEAFAPSGEPFFVGVDAGSTFVNPLDENFEAHTIAIYGIHETISRMPEEFLPEGYGRDELVEAVIDALPEAEGVSF